jgi:hypothetical protein
MTHGVPILGCCFCLIMVKSRGRLIAAIICLLSKPPNLKSKRPFGYAHCLQAIDQSEGITNLWEALFRDVSERIQFMQPDIKNHWLRNSGDRVNPRSFRILCVKNLSTDLWRPLPVIFATRVKSFHLHLAIKYFHTTLQFRKTSLLVAVFKNTNTASADRIAQT